MYQYIGNKMACDLDRDNDDEHENNIYLEFIAHDQMLTL